MIEVIFILFPFIIFALALASVKYKNNYIMAIGCFFSLITFCILVTEYVNNLNKERAKCIIQINHKSERVIFNLVIDFCDYNKE